MRTAFLFSGQGSQFNHMYQKFYNNDAYFKGEIDQLKEHSTIPLTEFGINSDSDDIFDTRIAQPLITAYQIAVTHALKAHGIYPNIVSGMSLGQYAALESAEVLNDQDVLNIVSKRGEIMEIDSQLSNTGMLALLGNIKLSQHIIEQSPYNSEIYISNFNSPKQLVVGGKRDVLLEFNDWLKNGNTKIRSALLKNEGAFHTDYFKWSSSNLLDYTKDFKFKTANIPIVDNELGTLVINYSPQSLASHMIHPVKWSKSIDSILDFGVDTIIEIGPGNQLLKLMRGKNFAGKKFSIQGPEDFHILKEVA